MSKKTKELNDAMAYQTEVADKLDDIIKGLDDIGDINGRPTTFYETMREAYEHRNNLDGLRTSLDNKQQENDPYQSQIDELSTTALQEIDWTPVNDPQTIKIIKNFC